MKKLFKPALLSLFLLFNPTAFANAKLSVILDWLVNPNHAPLFVAEQEGFFKQQGLDVEFISPADASSGEKMVAAGKADIAISYQPTLMHLTMAGLPVMRFATLIGNPLYCFVTLDDAKIQSMKDLKGKRIGMITQHINADGTLAAMLRHANLTMKDITPIYVNFNLMSALLSGQIDGFSSGMRNVEPITIELSSGKKTKVFHPEDYGFPHYEELIFITNKQRINDPSLIKFTAALKQGVAHLKKHPHESWKKFALQHPELNNQLNEKIWFATIKYFSTDPGKLNRKVYENLANFMWRNGSIKYLPKIEDYTSQ
jgi:putative hydroxymethylpyrimidine transport system substrate-binding protein